MAKSTKDYDYDFRKAVGVRLKEARNAAGMTLDRVGERLAVSRQVVSSWEAGKYMPMPENLPKIATLYGVTIDAILGRESAAQTVMEEAELALRGAATELTEEEMQSVADFIQFVRRQKREKGEGQ